MTLTPAGTFMLSKTMPRGLYHYLFHVEDSSGGTRWRCGPFPSFLIRWSEKRPSCYAGPDSPPPAAPHRHALEQKSTRLATGRSINYVQVPPVTMASLNDMVDFTIFSPLLPDRAAKPASTGCCSGCSLS
jgi:hypothetical protein